MPHLVAIFVDYAGGMGEWGSRLSSHSFACLAKGMMLLASLMLLGCSLAPSCVAGVVRSLIYVAMLPEHVSIGNGGATLCVELV